MKTLLKPVLAAGLVLTAASPLVEAPAAAQVVKGIGVVDINAVIANSSAFKTAEQQRPVTYKTQFDQANQRAEQINTQLQPLLTKFEADRQAANPNQESLAQQAQAIDQIYKQGQREVNNIMAPVELSRAYVVEQIQEKLSDAVTAASEKKNITLVIDPSSIAYADQSYNLNQAVVDELNTMLPTAQLVPPPGWLPREMRQQQAAMQAAQQGVQPGADAAAPAAAPTAEAGPPVTGR